MTWRNRDLSSYNIHDLIALDLASDFETQRTITRLRYKNLRKDKKNSNRLNDSLMYLLHYLHYMLYVLK